MCLMKYNIAFNIFKLRFSLIVMVRVRVSVFQTFM